MAGKPNPFLVEPWRYVKNFRVPLPPSTNHGYRLGLHGSRPVLVKTEALRTWEDVVACHVRPWLPPRQTPLFLTVTLHLPPKQLRTTDVDGPIKFIVDAIVGKRRDQWLDELQVIKQPTDEAWGWANVQVGPFVPWAERAKLGVADGR